MKNKQSDKPASNKPVARRASDLERMRNADRTAARKAARHQNRLARFEARTSRLLAEFEDCLLGLLDFLEPAPLPVNRRALHRAVRAWEANARRKV